jgi:hypothetical protein
MTTSMMIPIRRRPRAAGSDRVIGSSMEDRPSIRYIDYPQGNTSGFMPETDEYAPA